MTLKLDYIRETEKARLYKTAEGDSLWVPKSVITHTTKYPQSDPLRFQVHEVTIEDWWWDKQDNDDDRFYRPDTWDSLD